MVASLHGDSVQYNTTIGIGRETDDLSGKFKWPEYLVFGGVLFGSAAIGVFYGCFGSKQSTNEEFIMGNRQMAPFPVALSLLCR